MKKSPDPNSQAKPLKNEDFAFDIRAHSGTLVSYLKPVKVPERLANQTQMIKDKGNFNWMAIGD